MRGTVVLNGEQVEKLRTLDWTGPKTPPIETGEKLVRFIQDLNTVYGVDAMSCEGCHATRARICVACARIQVERIKAETRRYAEDAKTERAQYGAARTPVAKVRPPVASTDSGGDARKRRGGEAGDDDEHARRR